MDPNLKRLTDKHGHKLGDDPFFELRVKAIFRLIQTLDPNRDAENAKAEAFVTACVLEECYEDSVRYGFAVVSDG